MQMQDRIEMDEQDDVELWNREDAAELARPKDLNQYNIVVAARDWTIDTIVQQVMQENIDLDPAFQRRNAWRDHRRSRLIESLILGFPVPQIVLAENPRQKKSYIVIDGKQRLMTIAGLYLPKYRAYWTQPKFSGLNVLERFNKVTLDEFLNDSQFVSERRQLSNADVRTAIITGFSDESVLYDIFYRINTGSVSLSSQELRQVLNRGEFAKHLLEVTSEQNRLWDILGIKLPDPRLRDVELLLRLIAWRRFSTQYVGNMKPFLDDVMINLNGSWATQKASIQELINQILEGVGALIQIFGNNAGHKYKNGAYESALNRAVFEVQAYYFSEQKIRTAALRNKRAFEEAFMQLSTDKNFLASVEATTKSIENYKTRFNAFRTMLRKTLDVEAKPLPLGQGQRNK
jgi:hypothetical protein